MPKPTDAAAPADERARFRVLPLGHGRIFSGDFDRQTNRFVTLAKGDTSEADRATAERLEKLGLAEIINRL